MTFPQKVSHIWYYYKWFILGTVFVVGCIVSLIVSIASQKEDVFNVLIVDNVSKDAPRFITEQMKDRLHVTDDQEIRVDTTIHMDEDYNSSTVIYTSFQKFNTLLAVGDYDFIIDDGVVPQNYAEQDVLVDLRSMMTEEQQEQFEDRFYKKKNSEGQEIVAGIFIDGLPWTEASRLAKPKPLISIPANASHMDHAREMLQWILTYKEKDQTDVRS